jgi:hypothetical protein
MGARGNDLVSLLNEVEFKELVGFVEDEMANTARRRRQDEK